MSFLNKNLGDRPSLVKPIAIVIVVVLLIVGALVFFGGKKNLEGNPVFGENGDRFTVNSYRS